MDKHERLQEVAKRILNIADPWERDDLTPADVVRVIKSDPIGVIEHLLSTIEDLQA